jgi:tRNA(fMet)-specific endonuclease VapC
VADPAFLLDSNICIYILDGHPPQARERLEQCRPGELVTSAIVYAEVARGVKRHRPEEWVKLRRLFDLVTVLPFDRAAADAYLGLSFRRGQFDRLIGAHALALGLTLVTNNEADFADIAGLKVENWTLPPESFA